jgi:hypothetical protein
MKLSKVLSVRNVLRASGVDAIVSGAVMAVLPGPVSVLLFGKRKLASEIEKAVVRLLVSAVGIAMLNTGIKSVTAPVSKKELATTASLDGMWAVYHWVARLSGKWEEAEGVMKTNLAFAIGTTLVFAIQATALKFGEAPVESAAEESAADAKAPSTII